MRAMLVQTVLVIACVLAIPLAAQSQGASTASRSAWIEPAEISATVSADFLRHPISSKTRRMLRSAIAWMRSGEHQKAIQQLELTLAKDPASAAYVHSLLGYEFMRTDQVAAAIDSFAQAVLLIPHDPANHNNFAVSLAAAGDYERAEEEAQRAHQLAPDNPDIKRLLDALRDPVQFPRGTLNAQRGPDGLD